MSNVATPDLDLFLAESAWLRQLAASLASPEEADDLVQTAYERLLSDPPRHRDSPRGWLATVLRNARRMRHRSDARRDAREGRATEVRAVPSVEELAARAETLGILARVVGELDEPLRRVVLLHYCEGSSLAEIARAEGCPAATIRGRLRTGLQRLRVRLDEEHGGKRAVWMSAFAPLAIPRGPTAGAATSWVAWGAAAAVVVGLGVVAVGVTTSDPETPEPVRVATTPVAAAPVDTGALLAPPSPLRPDMPSSHLQSEEDRRRSLDAIQAARLTRLRDAGLDPEAVEQAAEDAELLGDIETMMVLEAAAELAESCREASPPIQMTTRIVDLEIIGEPDVGTVVETAALRASDHDLPDAWADCVAESLYLLSLPPPQRPGTQSIAFEFRTDAQGAVMTAPYVDPDAPSEPSE